MDFNYIIVQAGGKGTRLMPLTANRPKSLVPVNNKPILFHLFEKFNDKKCIIIGDYKFDVLARYLETYSPVDYLLIHGHGEGNAAGLSEALAFVPDGEPFMITWSDLLFSDDFDASVLPSNCYVGVTDRFPCSWSFRDNQLNKQPENEVGVAGCFLFENKQQLEGVPQQGSFTRFLQASNLTLHPMSLMSTQEVGTLEAIRRVDSKENRCRPYNKVTIVGEKVFKEGLTPEAKKLIQREVAWYKVVDECGFKGIPQVFDLNPLTIARIHGDNIFRVALDDSQKKTVIDNLVLRLDELHHLKHGTVNYFDMQEDYYAKTMKRLRTIASLIPFSNEHKIEINGKTCVNVLRNPEYLQDKVNRILTASEFGIIHGDCTLTNTMIDNDLNIYFIDARGYFGHTDLIGDVYYDWAKVYYSISGAFDQFNVRNFALKIGEDSVSFRIENSGWEHLTDYFISKIPNCDVYRIKLIHAIVWLSLASHCADDYDSLCLAFYNGLYLLNTLQ